MGTSCCEGGGFTWEGTWPEGLAQDLKVGSPGALSAGVP